MISEYRLKPLKYQNFAIGAKQLLQKDPFSFFDKMLPLDFS